MTGPQPVPSASNVHTIENEKIQLFFDPESNLLASILDKETGEVLKIQHNFFWYNASAGNNVNSTQASGAYIFRPNSTEKYVISKSPSYSVYSTDLVQEVRQTFSDYLSHVIRIFNHSNVIQLETTIAPLPINDSLGKEVITQFTTDLETDQQWYTDSNGMEYQQRIRNYRSTWPLNITDVVSGNYVPINVGAYLQDTNRDLQLTILSDRSQGCSSLNDGQLEVMIQRRLLYDDGRGVGEPLNETLTVKMTHWLFVNKASKASKEYRTMQQFVTSPIQMLFGEMTTLDAWKAAKTVYEPLQNALPDNVRLETLTTMEDGLVLLRLFHIYSIDEDPSMATNVTIDISTLFANIVPVEMHEMSLTANSPISNVHPLKWNIAGETAQSSQTRPEAGDFKVKLAPMDIKTFTIRFQRT